MQSVSNKVGISPAITGENYLISLREKVVCYALTTESSLRRVRSTDRWLEPDTLLSVGEVCLMVCGCERPALPLKMGSEKLWIFVDEMGLSLKEIEAIKHSWLKNSKKPKKMDALEFNIFAVLRHRLGKFIRAAKLGRPKTYPHLIAK